MRISDWSSDGCSSDLEPHKKNRQDRGRTGQEIRGSARRHQPRRTAADAQPATFGSLHQDNADERRCYNSLNDRSEEHTSELQSLMRISYAVFCLKKKKLETTTHIKRTSQAILHNKHHRYTSTPNTR